MSRLILGLLNAALVCGVIVQLMKGTQIDSLRHTPPRDLPTLHVESDVPRIQEPSAVQAQAIFYQTRAYYLPPPVDTTQAIPNYRLVGTMTIPQQGTIATVMSNETSSRTKVRQGDQLDGWTVLGISPTQVTIELNGRIAEIGKQANASTMLSRVGVGENAPSALPSGTITVLGNSSSALRAAPLGSGQRASGSPSAQSQEPSLRHYYPPPSPR